MFCQNTNATGLNYYSKNNLVREKRNITSLYSLIEKSPEHSKAIVENFSFRIALPRDGGLHRNESTKQLNASSSLKYFHLSGLHEYEQMDILKEAHMDTLSRNHSVKSIASRCSFSQVERWKRRALKNCYREEEEDHRGLGLRQNESQSEGLEDLAESVFRDGEIPEEMKAESVVIDKVGLSTVQKITNSEFFSHEPTPIPHAESYSQPERQPYPQKSTPQSKTMIPPEPLQPQISSSVLTANHIHSTIIQTSEIQIPDKLSTIQADMQYDQKDFFDLADSPIELIKADTNRHLSSEFGFDKNMEEELKEMLGYNKAEEKVPVQLEQQKAVVVENQEIEKPIVSVEVLEPPKPKKMNFKAMMSKNKRPESQEQKQEKKKRLLLSFFDQN